jgi:excisionase family DNA binding protein
MNQQGQVLTNWRDRAGLSPKEIMAVTGWSRSFTYKAIAEGHLRAVRVGERKLIVPVAEVEKLLRT